MTATGTGRGADASAERIESTPGQVTTLIVDTHLRGTNIPVEIVRLEAPATVLRARVYVHVDPVRDLWEVLEPGAVTVLDGHVLAAGPEGPVRVIVSAVA